MEQQVPEPDVATLLAELNEWEAHYGPLGGGVGLAQTGEAPSRINELKRLLGERGIQVAWNGKEYVVSVPGGVDS